MSEASTVTHTRPLPIAGSDVEAARKALTEALSEFLDPPRVDLAMQLWRRRFEGDDSLFLRLTFYCREVVRDHGLAGEEGNLHTAMMRALRRNMPMSGPTTTVAFDLSGVAPQSASRTTAARLSNGAASVSAPLRKKNGAHEVVIETAPEPEIAPEISAPPRSEGARVMQAFYASLEAQLARQLPPGVTPARVRRTLIRHARALPHEQRHPASLWWSGQASLLEGDWQAGGFGTALAKVMHNALTELLGAADADRCFKQATARLEASRDTTLHSIRKYL